MIVYIYIYIEKNEHDICLLQKKEYHYEGRLIFVNNRARRSNTSQIWCM